MDKVLIVVDMQKDFLTGPLGSTYATAIIPQVYHKIRDWEGNYLLYTMDSHIYPFYLGTVEGDSFPPHCELDTPGWELESNIAEAIDFYHWRDSENKIEKIEKDTFIGFEIEKYIEENFSKNPFEIHIVGLCTDICVISNALALRSMFPLARIIVDASCCAGTTLEKHKMALEIMRSNCIEVIND